MMIRAEEAKSLLGLGPDSSPSPSQVKAAYKSKAWETHPDRFPPHQKSRAEHQFKLISEAYSCLRSVGNPLSRGLLLFNSCKKKWRGSNSKCWRSKREFFTRSPSFPFHYLRYNYPWGLNATRAYKKTKGGLPFS